MNFDWNFAFIVSVIAIVTVFTIDACTKSQVETAKIRADTNKSFQLGIKKQ
jgi:hypothetical protein